MLEILVSVRRSIRMSHHMVYKLTRQLDESYGVLTVILPWVKGTAEDT